MSSRRSWLFRLIEGAGFTDHSEANGFSEHFHARMKKGAIEYGDRSKELKSVEELCDEAAEEGVDLPGWAVQASEKAAEDPQGRDDVVVEHFQEMVMSACVHALKAYQEIRLAKLFWQSTGPPPKPKVVALPVEHGGTPDPGTAGAEKVAA